MLLFSSQPDHSNIMRPRSLIDRPFGKCALISYYRGSRQENASSLRSLKNMLLAYSRIHYKSASQTIKMQNKL